MKSLASDNDEEPHIRWTGGDDDDDDDSEDKTVSKTSSHPPDPKSVILPLTPKRVRIIITDDDFQVSSSDSGSPTEMSSLDSEGVPSPSSMDSSHLPPSPSTTDNYAYLSPMTPILRSARNSLDPIGSTSDNSSLPPPSPTLSAQSSSSVRWATLTALQDNNPMEHDGSSSLYLAPPSRGYQRKRSAGTPCRALAVARTPNKTPKIIRVLGSVYYVPLTPT